MDTVDRATRSRTMSRIRSRSGLERRLPPCLRILGVSHGSRGMGVYGSPDFMDVGGHLALFLDGCFWHGCPEHYREPKSNVDFWRRKIARNRERDAEVTAALTSQGWTVLRIWEHDLRAAARHLKRYRKINGGMIIMEGIYE